MYHRDRSLSVNEASKPTTLQYNISMELNTEVKPLYGMFSSDFFLSFSNFQNCISTIYQQILAIERDVIVYLVQTASLLTKPNPITDRILFVVDRRLHQVRSVQFQTLYQVKAMTTHQLRLMRWTALMISQRI